MKLLAFLLIAYTAFCQTTLVVHRSVPQKSEAQQLREQVAALQEQNRQLQAVIDVLVKQRFQPVQVGDQTFNTEEEFIAYHNGVAARNVPIMVNNSSPIVIPPTQPLLMPTVGNTTPEIHCTTQYAGLLNSAYTTCQ